MSYSVEFTKRAHKNLKKLDKPTAILITSWIRKNLQGTSNPHQHGKALTGNHKGKWRYRVGDFRLLSEIVEDKIIILILEIGHRKEIY